MMAAHMTCERTNVPGVLAKFIVGVSPYPHRCPSKIEVVDEATHEMEKRTQQQ